MAGPKGLAELVLVVEAIAPSVAFYRDGFGMVLEKPADESWAWFRMGDGSRLGLTTGTLLFEEASPRVELPMGRRLGGPVHFAVSMDAEEGRAARERLAAMGVAVHGPTEFAWMGARSWYAYDPSGNLAEIWVALEGQI